MIVGYGIGTKWVQRQLNDWSLKYEYSLCVAKHITNYGGEAVICNEGDQTISYFGKGEQGVVK